MSKIKADQKPYKGLIFISMFYFTFFIASAILAHRLALYGHTIGSAATLVFPVTYVCCDVVAEVYGYSVARILIWSGLICELIFALAMHFLILLPYPESWRFNSDYSIVLSPLLRIFFASLVATTIGSFLNIYVLAKWRILVKGRYFIIRSFCASTVGEFIFTVVADLIIFFGKVPFSTLFQIMLTSYLFKILFSPVAVIPAAGFVKLLRKVERVELDETNLNFNPFKFSSE